MPPEPVPADPGRDQDPARYVPEPEGPWWLERGGGPVGGSYPFGQVHGRVPGRSRRTRPAPRRPRRGRARRPGWARSPRRPGDGGPGQPGSAEIFPGEYPGRAAQFASGMLMDTMPGGPELARFADQAVGPGDRFGGVSDDELLGVLCAWDRVAAHATARKYAAVAELVRRRPAAGSPVAGAARMPLVWEEFTASELCSVLAGSRHDAADMLSLAHELEVMLPGTESGLRGRDPGRGEGGDHRSGHRGPDPGGGPRGRGAGAGPGRAADPGRAAVRDHPSRYPGRPGEGKEAAGAGGAGRHGRNAGPRRPGTWGWPGRRVATGPRRWPRIRRITALARLPEGSPGWRAGVDELRARAYLDLIAVQTPETYSRYRYCPSMGPSPAVGRRRRAAWALSEPSAVLLWQLGMAWSSAVAAVVDASMGRHLVLSGFVLIGPVCVSFTGRWLRTAVAGVWAIGLVMVLGIPDGIWGTGLERLLIGLAVLVALGSTLALVVTVRACLGLMVTASLASGCGSPASSSGQRPAVSRARDAAGLLSPAV